jgi:hypothetical protein
MISSQNIHNVKILSIINSFWSTIQNNDHHNSNNSQANDSNNSCSPVILKDSSKMDLCE